MSTRRGAPAQVAKSIPFNKTGIKFKSEKVQDAIEEIRANAVLAFDELTSSLNGNHNISVDDANIHYVIGSATGYSVTLPDATALFLGRRFEVVNGSSETITVKDNSGAVKATLISGDVGELTLENNGTAAGNWLATVISSAATGIASYSVGSDTTFTTTSATDVFVTGMTTTPVQGRYAVFFSSDIEIAQNNRLAQCVIYVGGTAVARTRRTVQGVSSNFSAAFNTIGEISVNGSQAVELYVNISTGSLDVNQRRLILIRLGS